MERFFRVLRTIVEKLKGTDFAVLGSYNLYLQGIEINPKDLDLITDDNGIHKFSDLFKSSVTRNKEGYKETEFEIDSVEIHVVSNLNNELRPPFRDDIIWLEKDNLRIPCMSLESELSFYEKIHREKDKGKVKLIKQKLNK